MNASYIIDTLETYHWKDEEKGAGAPAEDMEDEICFLGLGMLAHTRHAS